MAEARTGFGANGAKETYDRLVNDRSSYETRAENAAALTIPSLFPKSSDGASTDYTQPWQSVGARGLNNIAAKLMLALFPSTPWMRLQLSEFQAKEVLTDPQQLSQIDASLSMVERILMSFMDANSYHPTLFELLKQLLVAGNGLLYLPPPEGDQFKPPKLYKLHSYVVQRDPFGTILQMITYDRVAFAALPEDVRNTLEGDHDPDELIDVHTHIYLDDESGDQYLSYQEVGGNEVDGSDGQYPLDSCPWIPVRYVKMDGENYGRSHVEEYMGDLQSLENLTESIVKFSMIASKVVGLVNPNGITQVRRLVKAQTGDFVPGRVQDIEFLQLDKTADFSVARTVAENIEGRLSYAFMLNSAVQRQGERVTAEEIRYVAKELEDTLGGVYSILARELQLPIVRNLMTQLQATQLIPDMPKEAVEPTVSTGMEALGRGQDLDKLTQFTNLVIPLSQVQDPDLNIGNLKVRIANALGLDTAGLILTDADKAKQLAQSAMQDGVSAGAQGIGAGAAAQATASPDAMSAAMDSMGVQASPVGQVG
ncbi:portal protein [Pseudomonas sp. B14(2017)]|uniref:portal protein n=1 Tax=Pseudomonas sp. B14(2017) TaxID=1981745 RepID=UPI000A1D99D4|nr:portal protein [Pseudomonas sp. B14(2017)]